MNLKNLLIESKLSATNESRKKYSRAYAAVYIKNVKEMEKYIQKFDSFYDYIKSTKMYKNKNYASDISLEFTSLRSGPYGYVDNVFEHTLNITLKQNGRDFYVNKLHNLFIKELVEEFFKKSKFLEGFDVEYSPDVISVGGHAFSENAFSIDIVVDYTNIADQFNEVYTLVKRQHGDYHLRDAFLKDKGESPTTLKGILYKEIDFDEFADSDIKIQEDAEDLFKIFNPSNSKLSSSAKKIYKETVDWINKANERSGISKFEKEGFLLKRNYKAFNDKKAILTYLSIESLREQFLKERRSGKNVDDDFLYLLKTARYRLLDNSFTRYAIMLKRHFPNLASWIW